MLNLITTPQSSCGSKTSGMILNCELCLSIILSYGQSPDLYILEFIHIRNLYLLLGCKTFWVLYWIVKVHPYCTFETIETLIEKLEHYCLNWHNYLSLDTNWESYLLS